MKMESRITYPASSRSGGFTLIELCVVIAILGIFLSMALPAMQNLLRNDQTTATANDLLAALRYTRTQALTTGRVARLVATGGNWQNGWQVLAADVVQMERGPAAVNVDALGATPADIHFLSRGTLRDGAAQFRVWHPADPGAARIVSVSLSGQAVVAPCGDTPALCPGARP